QEIRTVNLGFNAFMIKMCIKYIKYHCSLFILKFYPGTDALVSGVPGRTCRSCRSSRCEPKCTALQRVKLGVLVKYGRVFRRGISFTPCTNFAVALQI